MTTIYEYVFYIIV